MSSRKYRVLIVDDSALLREIVADHLQRTDSFEVAAFAESGQRALEILNEVNPDVITLDVQMPGMDGLQTLREILVRRPVPVVMVSSLTRFGASVTLEALELGAIDYVAKPEAGVASGDWHADFIRRLKMAAATDVKRVIAMRTQRASQRKQAPASTAKPALPGEELANKLIALGISTGGPPALTYLFERLQPPLPPIVVVQHMPADFTKPFAARLDSLSKLRIKEAETGDVLEPNCVYIAPGGKHLEIVRVSRRSSKIHIRNGEPVSGHRPSVDVMMKSAAAIYGERCLGVIMTGMGRDGTDGCLAIKQAGGFVLGQDERSSDVFGMNRAAFLEGGVDKQFPLDQAATIIEQTVRRLWTPAGASA